MGFLRYGAPTNVLLVTKGHPFERDAFFAVFEGWRDVACTAVEQPAAQALLTPEAAAPYDAIVFYDMPGIEFRREQPPVLHAPPERFARGLLDLVEAGKGVLFLHHAIAGWPAWDAYGDLVGGRFLYAPATVRGRPCADSGYRHDVVHRVSAVDASHPVVRGLEAGFEIEDELYLCEVFEEDVVPLLRSDAAFVEENFHSAALALRGETSSRRGWSHDPGSSLVGWAQRRGRSPIVTLLPGDGPSAYSNPGFRRLVENAVRWVAGAEARRWAEEGRGAS